MRVVCPTSHSVLPTNFTHGVCSPQRLIMWFLNVTVFLFVVVIIMGSVHSCVAASLAVCSLYFVYVHIYCSHALLKRNVLNNDRLPGFVYLYIKYLCKALTRRTGCLYATSKRELVYTIFNCRLETPPLRRFCSAAGYGWDYPDTEFRDIPLCVPEFLCRKLLLMVLTDGHFRLSPAGLLRVHQTLKTLQPVDELKKGPFMLQVQVLEYRQIDAGAQADVRLSATSRTGCLVWESVLTLQSQNELHKADRCLPRKENECQPDESEPENVKQVELRVPWAAGLQCVWSSSDFSPFRLLSVPARLFGCSSPSLWMLSVCLAEVEKHKGVEVITAPVNVTARFMEPVLVPGRVTVKFWETTENQGRLSFCMQRHGGRRSHVMGQISRLT